MKITNIIELHNEYAVVKIIAKNYVHHMKIDIEDLCKIREKVRVSKKGYAYTCKEGKSVSNVIMNHEPNYYTMVDHVNGDRLDNRKVNLRVISAGDNCRNRHSFSRNNTGTVGIAYRKNGNYEYYRVSLTDQNKKRFTKQFNINKLGEESAFKLATECLNLKKLEFGYFV